MMARLSGVDIHDFGTTFKAYRRDVDPDIPLYGEMHRFIPALASCMGEHLRGGDHQSVRSRAQPLWALADVSSLL